jgi:hypothetical protein
VTGISFISDALTKKFIESLWIFKQKLETKIVYFRRFEKLQITIEFEFLCETLKSDRKFDDSSLNCFSSDLTFLRFLINLLRHSTFEVNFYFLKSYKIQVGPINQPRVQLLDSIEPNS